MTEDNNLLGTFNLNGIPPAPRGAPQIEVTFDIDANGILNVSALDKSTGKSNRITIKNEKGRLSKEEIDRMLRDAEAYKDQDEKARDRVTARNKVENYVFSVKQAVNEYGDKLSPEDKQTAIQACDDSLRWIENNTLAEKDEFQHHFDELQRKCSPIMTKLHGGGHGGGPQPQQQARGCGQQAGGFGGGPQQQGGPRVEEVD